MLDFIKIKLIINIMKKFKCKECGKNFYDKPSRNRKFCSTNCSSEYRKNKPTTQKGSRRVEYIKVKCATCGKEEEVTPSRAKSYNCCSGKCSGEFNRKKFSQKIELVCPICKTIFYLKPSHVKRVKNQACCSKKCTYKLRETLYKGKGNHQFGLKGELNSSFKGMEIHRNNNHLKEIIVYKPDRIDAIANGRITKHRLTVCENYHLFDSIFFIKVDDYYILKPNVVVHHIDEDHDNNDINNLIPLTKAQHTSLHNNLKYKSNDYMQSITGVFKQGELLETPAEDNQQPSLDSNIFEGSETNNRSLSEYSEGGKIDTSALLDKYEELQELINDNIVQTRIITEEAYKSSIKEILESEIKSSEIKQ